MIDTSEWTYGVEHELSDWDCKKSLPNGYARAPDYTIVNTSCIAAQLDTSLYHYGGEFNTPPTLTPEGQCKCLEEILNVYPECTTNYRSNLHIHIRVPELKNNLSLLKRIQLYIHQQLPTVIKKIDPIPTANRRAERKRQSRMFISHHSFLSEKKLKEQMNAKTTDEFFNSEVPKHPNNSRPLWHLQPRLCVNLRQILQTDTIEFRHFFGHIDSKRLLHCIEWCRDFLIAAMDEVPIASVVKKYEERKLIPITRCLPFSVRMELGYQATNPHKRSKQEILESIKMIESGKFFEDVMHPLYKQAANDTYGT